MNQFGSIVLDKNDPIVITGQSMLAPTGVTPEEVFQNQINGVAKHVSVTLSDYSSMNAIKQVMLKNKEHPIIQTGKTDEEVTNALNKVIEMGGGLSSFFDRNNPTTHIRGEITQNGEKVGNGGIVELIKNTIKGPELDDEHKETILGLTRKGGFDPAILHSIYLCFDAAKKAGILEGHNSNIPVNLGHGFAGVRNVEVEGLTKGIILGNKRAMALKHPVATLPNMPAPIVANMLKYNAGATVDTQACAAAGYAYEKAIMNILLRKSDIAIAGGCDSMADSLYGLASFARMGALQSGYQHNPQAASRPFAKAEEGAQKGFVLGEGGGVSILERLSHVENQGGIYHTIFSGIGTSTCNPIHEKDTETGKNKGLPLSSGTVEGQSLSMKRALESAGITAEEFVKEGGVVFAHGTATEMGDRTEANSIYETFGEGVPVTAPKGVLGHALGGSAAQSISIAISSMKQKIVPGILNFSEKNRMDGLPDLDFMTENRNITPKYILINAFGFGGHNVSIILKNPSA